MALATLREAGISLNRKKCYIFTDSVKYLGHIIMLVALAINEAPVKRLSQAQHPWNDTKLRCFFGLCNLYGCFVSYYTDIAAPLTKFLQKTQPRNFPTLGNHETQTFDKLIRTISSKSVLALLALIHFSELTWTPVTFKWRQPYSRSIWMRNVSQLGFGARPSIPTKSTTQCREKNAQPSFGYFKPSYHIFKGPIPPCTPTKHYNDSY